MSFMSVSFCWWGLQTPDFWMHLSSPMSMLTGSLLSVCPYSLLDQCGGAELSASHIDKAL